MKKTALTPIRIIKDKNGNFTAARGENPLNCPFQRPVTIRGPLGKEQLIIPQCNSFCPHFNLHQVADENGKLRTPELTISCSGFAPSIEVEIEDMGKGKTVIQA